MKRTNPPIPRPARLLVRLACLITICSGGALAHPLGNFAVCHFARLEVAGDRIKVRYVIDMAEIPTLQELQRISSQGNSPSKAELDAYLKAITTNYADGLLLEADNSRVPLVRPARN
jgi:hypothetical protein